MGFFLLPNCKKEDQQSAQPAPPEKIDSVSLVKNLKIKYLEGVFDPGNFMYGTVSALKNGKDWKASSYVRIADTIFEINAATFSPDGDLREYLSFTQVPRRLGLYRCKKPDNNYNESAAIPFYSRLGLDGDVVFLLLAHNDDYAATDYVELTKLDTVNRVVGGRFDLHMTDSLYLPPPVYLHLENGTFESKY